MKRLFFLLSVIAALQVAAQAPEGYYTPAVGKSEATLKTALYDIIKGHKDKGYDALYNIYKTSDRTDDGKVWDMYSTCTWEFGSKTCGSYSNVCDCYNREHSVPQSWFGSAKPMVSDAFHVYPTDGKVNGIRGNLPFGETNALPLGGKALGKKGTSSFPGYTGTVFEPVDEYKGDFARTYFYFATRYQNIMPTIRGESFNRTSYPSFSSWSLELFLKWHRQDPVSPKEITRNNAVYAYQKNRNPFIDHPELAEYIWGTKKGTSWKPGGGVEPPPIGNCEDLNFSAPFTSDMAPFIEYSVTGEQKWKWKNAQYGVVMSGYVNNNGTFANEDWLISPKFDLSKHENVVLQFEHTINKGNPANMQNEATLWVSNNYTDNPTTATWTQLTIPTYPSGDNWTFVSSGNIVLPEAFCKADTRLAFKYTCGTNKAATWEIKHLQLTGKCIPTHVSQTTKPKQHIISSLRNGIIIHNLERENVAVFTALGAPVAQFNNTEGNITIDLPGTGIYIVKIGTQATKVIVNR